MDYLNDEDHKRFQRHEELEKELSKARDECIRVSNSYHSNSPSKSSAEDLIKAQENLLRIWDEWRSTITTLKKSQN